MHKNYIIGKKIDLIAFTSCIPILIIYGILKYFNIFPELANISSTKMFWGWVFVDGSHVYSTIFVSYLDRDIVKKVKKS